MPDLRTPPAPCPRKSRFACRCVPQTARPDAHRPPAFCRICSCRRAFPFLCRAVLPEISLPASFSPDRFPRKRGIRGEPCPAKASGAGCAVSVHCHKTVPCRHLLLYDADLRNSISLTNRNAAGIDSFSAKHNGHCRRTGHFHRGTNPSAALPDRHDLLRSQCRLPNPADLFRSGQSVLFSGFRRCRRKPFQQLLQNVKVPIGIGCRAEQHHMKCIGILHKNFMLFQIRRQFQPVKSACRRIYSQVHGVAVYETITWRKTALQLLNAVEHSCRTYRNLPKH